MIKPDDLSALWQSQPVSPIDTAKIKSAYARQRRQQRLYMLVDALSLMPAIVLVWLGWESFSSLAAGMLIAILLLTLPFILYLIWLRRVAAFGGTTDTRSHLNALTRQVKNNVTIARITRHSAWISAIVLAGFFGVLYLNGEVGEKKLSEIVVTIAGISVLMAGCYWWAKKREARFAHQLDELEALAGQLDASDD